jgi:hypothetical protein
VPKVTMSNKVSARPEAIWQAIGSFGAIANWHPMIERAETDGSGSGSTRTLHLLGGGKLVERLEQENPGERRYIYTIVDGPLPVRDYRSEIKVSDNGDGTSTIEWSSSFESTTSDTNSAVKSIEDIYRAGLDNIQKLYGMGR